MTNRVSDEIPLILNVVLLPCEDCAFFCILQRSAAVPCLHEYVADVAGNQRTTEETNTNHGGNDEVPRINHFPLRVLVMVSHQGLRYSMGNRWD